MMTLDARLPGHDPRHPHVPASLQPQDARAPDHEGESRALCALARTLAASPRSVFQKVADLALELCGAHAAGVSLIEDEEGERVFRWRGLAGPHAKHLGRNAPRTLCPWGVALDADSVELMQEAMQRSPDVEGPSPVSEEALLIPFHGERSPAGIIWVASHDRMYHFDAEHARLLTSLGTFAVAACEVLASFELMAQMHTQRGRAAELAMAADRNKERFIHILAHELRGPLSPLQNVAALLGAGVLDAAAQRECAAVIERQANGIGRIVEDLLDVGRLSVGRLLLRRRRTTVSQIVDQALETAAPTIHTRNHTLTVDLPQQPIVLEVDLTRMSQVVHNLLVNAAKYTDPGGQIQIGAHRVDDEVILTVSDTGAGIAAADIDAIFNLYEQAGHATAARSDGGLGIGLYLARAIVEAHGGTICAKSAGPGKGSEFAMRLKVRRGLDEAAGGHSPS